jgi:uncharacterized protein DUF5666
LRPAGSSDIECGMHARRVLLPAVFSLFAVLVAACGGGGSSGRPPTTVDGNVRSASAGTARHGLGNLWRLVRAWTFAEAVAQVPGITVSIQGSANTTTTDSNGFFRLEGNQFGPAILQFVGNGANATLPVTLPAGGGLDLIDVDLVGTKITVSEQRISFEGPITGIDCHGNLLQVLSGELVPFRVRLQSSTVLVDQDGAPLNCGSLSTGPTAQVQGNVDSKGDVEATRIQVSPATNATPTPVAVGGTVASLDCPTDMTVARNSGGNVQVNLSSSTQITDQGGGSLQCTDLGLGDSVHVQGTSTSFGINASTVERVAPTPTPTPTP